MYERIHGGCVGKRGCWCWWIGWLALALALSVEAATYPRPNLVTPIDLDGDGTAELELRQGPVYPNEFPVCFFVQGADGIGLYGLKGAMLLTDGGSCLPQVRALDALDSIGPAAFPVTAWRPSAECLIVAPNPIGAITNGPFLSRTHAYVGFRLPTAQGNRYGWVELASDVAGARPSVVAFAIEGVAEKELAAGAEPTSEPPRQGVPILVPPDQRAVGGILRELTTNALSGEVTMDLRLELPPDVECLASPPFPGGPTETVPAACRPRTFLSDLPSPSRQWLRLSSPAPLLTQTRNAAGQVVAESGPFAGVDPGRLALRTSAGDVWWVKFDADGKVQGLGRTPAGSTRWLVDEPVDLPGSISDYIDVNQDGLVDFLVSRETKTSGTPFNPLTERMDWLAGMSGQRILMGATQNLAGIEISGKPTPVGRWEATRRLLMHVSVTTDNFFGSFSTLLAADVLPGAAGYVGVEFTSAAGVHYGWIRFNRYREFLNVAAGQARWAYLLDLIDFGAAPGPGEAVTVGEMSTLPLTLRPELVAGRVRVAWDRVARLAILESTRTLEGAGWTRQFTGGASQYESMEPWDGTPWFFRLRPAEPKPADVIATQP